MSITRGRREQGRLIPGPGAPVPQLERSEEGGAPLPDALRKALEFEPDHYALGPSHWRFFAVNEMVSFGDLEQVLRMDADLDYDPEVVDYWNLSAGDFGSPAAAEWIAHQLNVAIGRATADGSGGGSR